MEKIAEKCILGKVIKKALKDVLTDNDQKDVFKIYYETFLKTVQKHKEDFEFVDLKGTYLVMKEYPEDDYHQAQDILLSNL